MCGGSRRRAERMAAMNGMGPGYGMMGGPFACGHACAYGCQSGCGHQCQQVGCYSGYQRGYGGCGNDPWAMGMYGGYGRGCCGGRRRQGGLIRAVIVPLVKKAIDNHNEKKALALAQAQPETQQPQMSTTRSVPQENSVVGGPFKNEKTANRNNSQEKGLNLVKTSETQPPAYTPEGSPFIGEEEKELQIDLPSYNLPQTPAMEQLLTQLTNAIIAHHTNRKCGTKRAVDVATKALRDELEEIEEARKGRGLSCSEWKALKNQVNDIVGEIESVVGANH